LLAGIELERLSVNAGRQRPAAPLELLGDATTQNRDDDDRENQAEHRQHGETALQLFPGCRREFASHG
jgi:hypothetical protein